MRLIDADEFEVYTCVNKSTDYVEGVQSVIEAIDAAPTVDAVPVVRCKDCIHYIAGYCCRDTGTRTNMVKFEPDDFCSYAARRDAP